MTHSVDDVAPLNDSTISPLPLPSPSKNPQFTPAQFPGSVKRRAYCFDGLGHYFIKEWDLTGGDGRNFTWYHVELPRDNQRPVLAAQYLIDVLCPPLKLQDILSLITNGPFCGHVNGALVFRVNAAGPASSEFTLRLAARVTENSVITVSLGRVPRLEFSQAGRSLLSEVPRGRSLNGGVKDGEGDVVIEEHVLDFLLTMNHSEEADNPVPKSVSQLLLHIVDRHVDQVQDIVTRLEMELDSVELELDKGSSLLKKKMLNDRKFPKMNLNLQRLLQVVSHGEQVLPRVKEKCASKNWFPHEDNVALEELVGRLRRLKENLGFIANRINAVQAGLDSWQAEQINKKLYYLSVLSMIFLPTSIVTGIFGMNVGGVPWTSQASNPETKEGFINVMTICAIVLLVLLLCFIFPSLYMRVSAWRRQMKRNWSIKKLSFMQRNLPIRAFHEHEYMLI